MHHCTFPYLLSRILNRLNDIVIPRTSAEIPFKRMANIIFGWLRIVLQQIGGGHYHAGCAETALQSVAFLKSFLQRMQFTVVRQAFNSGDVTAIGLNRQQGAALGSFAIYMYGAGAAATGIATHMRAC
jgi:hypothetical protein